MASGSSSEEKEKREGQTVLKLRDSQGSHTPGYEFGDRGNPREFRHLMDCNGL
jgi:hypothetical protein